MKPLKTMIASILIASILTMLYAGYLGKGDPSCAHFIVLSMILAFIGLAGVMTYDGSEP